MRKKLVRNRIRCNHCGDEIESKHRHDFVMCSCRTVFVDGGIHYMRRGYTISREDFTDLSEFEEEQEQNDREGQDT